MISVFANTTAVSFKETLGVLLFHNRLLSHLKERADIQVYIVNDKIAAGKEKLPSDWKFPKKALIPVSAAKELSAKGQSVELLMHQFQTPVLDCESLLFAHDLHISDLAWKYQKSGHRARFVANLKSAHSVVTMFPRTYYDLERLLGVSVQNFFQISSPLMNDFSSISNVGRKENSLLYPAQLQVHKNHIALLAGLKHYIQNGGKIKKMYLTGSGFFESGVDIKSKIAEYELGDTVAFLGKLRPAEFQKLYRKVKGIIVPSIAEGGAYVALEGIAAKKLVAVNSIRAAKMHAQTYDAHIHWFEAHDTTQTSAAIAKLLGGDLSLETKKNARARDLLGQESWQDASEQTAEIIKFITGNEQKPLVEADKNLANNFVRERGTNAYQPAVTSRKQQTLSAKTPGGGPEVKDDVLPFNNAEQSSTGIKTTYSGKRIFVFVDNIDSEDVPLRIFKDEFTFATNGFHHQYCNIDWKPTFYAVDSSEVKSKEIDSLIGLTGSVFFIDEQLKGRFRRGSDVHYYRRQNPQLDETPSKETPPKNLAVAAAVQIAHDMGFDPIYLVGSQTNFNLPSCADNSAAQTAAAVFKCNEFDEGLENSVVKIGSVLSLGGGAEPTPFRTYGFLELSDVFASGILPDYPREAHATLDETLAISLLFDPKNGTQRNMIDVGAHHGHSAKHFVSKGFSILCFEPDADNRENHLARTFANASNVTIDTRAVGNRDGNGVPFYTSVESSGLSSLSAFMESHVQSCEVETTTIKSAVAQYNIDKIDFLKIDVEGHDFFVIQGVPWDQMAPDIIECEYEDFKTVPLGYTWKDVAEFLRKKGYSVYISEWHPIIRYGIPHDWRRIVPYPGNDIAKTSWGNILAFKNDPGYARVLEVFKQVLRNHSEPDPKKNLPVNSIDQTGLIADDGTTGNSAAYFAGYLFSDKPEHPATKFSLDDLQKNLGSKIKGVVVFEHPRDVIYRTLIQGAELAKSALEEWKKQAQNFLELRRKSSGLLTVLERSRLMRPPEAYVEKLADTVFHYPLLDYSAVQFSKLDPLYLILVEAYYNQDQTVITQLENLQEYCIASENRERLSPQNNSAAAIAHLRRLLQKAENPGQGRKTGPAKKELLSALQNAQRLRLQLNDMDAKLQATVVDRDQTQDELEGVYKSNSWALTRPMRYLKRLL